jgi:DNA (cytosine-5)-methyltransferase 1
MIDSNVPNLNIVDLFAGVGGFHYGIKEAVKPQGGKVTAVLVSELDRGCQGVYHQNFSCDVQGDINQLDVTSRYQGVDLVTAGFPCQPFSNSGRKLGLSDPRGQFYFRIEEIVKAYGAKAFILENVPGIKRNGGGNYRSVLAQRPQTVGRTMRYLEENLLKLNDYKVLWEEVNSSYLGSPQARKRVFIVGIHKDLYRDFSFELFKQDLTPFVNISDSDHDPELELTQAQSNNIRSFMSKPPKFNAGMRRVGQAYLCPGGNVGQCYHAFGLVPTLTKVWARFYPIYFPHPNEKIPSLNDREFVPNEYYGSGYIRRASVGEVYRLQGFPNEFVPSPNCRFAYEHAGNAVNVDVVKYLVRKILRDILY